MREFTLKKKADHDAIVRKVIFDLATIIIRESPVDTGRFRANWQYGFGVQPQGELDAFDTSSRGQQTVDQIAGSVTTGAGVHYLVNNLPYAEVLEYGLYPDPVAFGTYVRAGQNKYGIKGPGYVQRSEGGYSKQAPYGMVRIAVEQVSSALQSSAAVI